MRRSPRNLRIACNHTGLTHYGGVYFFHEFIQVLQLRRFLCRHLAYPRRNQRYTLSQMTLALVYPILLGLGRIETASFSPVQRYLSVSDRAPRLSGSPNPATVS